MTKFYKTEKRAQQYCPANHIVVECDKGFTHQLDPNSKGQTMPEQKQQAVIVNLNRNTHQEVPEGHRQVTGGEAQAYANIVLRRAFEYLADMKDEDFADRDDAHQMLVIKQVSEAMLDVEERLLSDKVEQLMARLLIDGPNHNPRLVAKLCRNLAKGFTAQVFGANKAQENAIAELVKAGVDPEEAEYKATEPNDYAGAVDDITDARYRPSANLVRQSAEVAYELLNQYFVRAEASYMQSRSMRMGTLPWATFLIDPNVPAVGFHQALDLDEALRWKATQQAQRQEDQREKDQAALRIVAGL